MSTRSNIVIKKTVNNEIITHQFYHHFDGYPEGVGFELLNKLNEVSDIEDDIEMYKAIMDIDDSYEAEGQLNLHGDIEYLYVIDLDDRKLKCYSIWVGAYNDMEYVLGNFPKRPRNYLSFECGFNTPKEDVKPYCWWDDHNV